MSDTERKRLQALQSYRILDTAPEPAFDEIAELAAHIFQAPIALVSLVDGERQWSKAHVGITPAGPPREDSFGAAAVRLAHNSVMVIEDARADPAFADNPYVREAPFIRFYAGALITNPEGCTLGTLCVLAPAPRARPSEADLGRLQSLSRRVVDQLERARAERSLAEQHRLL